LKFLGFGKFFNFSPENTGLNYFHIKLSKLIFRNNTMVNFFGSNKYFPE
jgi:hypothetical protein